MPEAWELCLSRRQMMLTVNDMERVVQGYVVPFFILFGTLGNAISLMVLLSPQMRNRSQMLCYLSIADVVFLLLMSPHAMANHELFALNYYFRQVYLRMKTHLLAFTNWASAAAIWLVLLICTERVLGVRYPLLMKKYSSIGGRRRAVFIAAFICATTGLLTAYIHITYDTFFQVFCNGTQPHALHTPMAADPYFKNRTNPHPKWVRDLVMYNTWVHATFLVILPAVVIVAANAVLLHTLRRRNAYLLSFNSTALSNNFLNAQVKTEHNITCTVCAIVTCFTFTQAPSAILHQAIGFLDLKVPVWKHNLQIVMTCMVVIGKSLNFVLFCLSSATFRQRLVSMIKSRCRNTSNFKPGTGTTAVTYYTNTSSSGSRKRNLVEAPYRVAPGRHYQGARRTARSQSSVPPLSRSELRRFLDSRRAVSFDTEPLEE